MLASSPTSSQDSSYSVLDTSAERLRQLVARGQLGTAQPLIELDLASRLGVSRTTVREALRRLESEGLFVARRRGLQVRRLGRQDVKDLYELRELLEGLAARRAAARGSEDARSWQRRLTLERSLWTSPAINAVAFSVQNRAFHDLIVEAAANAHLPRMLDQTLMTLFAAQFKPWVPGASLAGAANGHVRVLDALLGGAEAQAERAMRRHIRESAKVVLALPDSAFA